MRAGSLLIAATLIQISVAYLAAGNPRRLWSLWAHAMPLHQPQPLSGSVCPNFCQCGLASAGRLGHRFKEFRLPYRLALTGCVNLPSP
jgi:hypothetical protein